MEFEILENGIEVRRCMLKMVRQTGNLGGHKIVGKLIHSPPSVVTSDEFPNTGIVERGKQYSLSVPNRIEVNGKRYRFIKWSDGVRSPQRDVDPKVPFITLKAYYGMEKEATTWPIPHANPQRTRALDVAIPSIDPSNPEIVWRVSCDLPYLTEPLVADVNNDGENELVVIGWDTSKPFKIYIIKEGEVVKTVSSSEFGYTLEHYGNYFNCVCVDDVDGDGRNELIFLFFCNDNWSHLFIMRFYEDNSYKLLVDKKVSCCASGVLPIDLDSDGVKEILMLASGNYDAGNCQSRLGCYDLKEDNLVKIDLLDDQCAGSTSNVVCIKDNYVAINGENYLYTGELKNPISSINLVKHGNIYGNQLILEDIDRDGVPEIILGGALLYTLSTTSTLGPVDLYVLKFDGSIVGGAKNVVGPIRPDSCVSLADVDEDGNSEIVAVSTKGISVFEALTGKVKFSKNLPVSGVVSVAVGDVNSDGQLEIVRSFSGGVNIWNPLSNKLWTVSFSGGSNYVAIGDVDNDDQLEIVVTVASSPNIYVIKFR